MALIWLNTMTYLFLWIHTSVPLVLPSSYKVCSGPYSSAFFSPRINNRPQSSPICEPKPPDLFLVKERARAGGSVATSAGVRPQLLLHSQCMQAQDTSKTHSQMIVAPTARRRGTTLSNGSTQSRPVG